MSTQSVSFDELSVVPERRQSAPADAAIAFPSEDFLRQEADWRHGFGRRARLSSEILAAAVAAIDFCLVLIGAAAAFTVYFDLMNRTTAEPGRYVLTALFA